MRFGTLSLRVGGDHVITRGRRDVRGMLAVEYALLVLLVTLVGMTLARFTASELAALFALAARAI